MRELATTINAIDNLVATTNDITTHGSPFVAAATKGVGDSLVLLFDWRRKQGFGGAAMGGTIHPSFHGGEF